MTREETISGRFLILLITAASLLPNPGGSFSLFGFHWTFYRLAVILILIISLAVKTGALTIRLLSFSGKMILFLTVWIMYGLLLLFCAPYADMHSGLIELLSILNGLFAVVIIYEVGRYEGALKTIAAVMIVIAVFLTAFGVLEILTGRHLATSSFCDPKSPFFQRSELHMATGFQYNTNDFSALLSCLFPVVLLYGKRKIRWLCLAGIFGINLVNDATTCNLALVVCIAYFLVSNRDIGRDKRLVMKVLIFCGIIAAGAILVFGQSYLLYRNDILGAISRHLYYVQQGKGSLYIRLTIYKDTVRAWMKSGILGMGPASFSGYFLKNPSLSDLVNPHSLLLEILFQYGILILAGFLVLLFGIFNAARKIYRESGDADVRKRAMTTMMLLIVYLISSFAPSAFLGYSYQWLLLALCCLQLDLDQTVRKEEYA